MARLGLGESSGLTPKSHLPFRGEGWERGISPFFMLNIKGRERDIPLSPALSPEGEREIKMTKPRVLISDQMDPKAEQIFRERGCDVDVKIGRAHV